MITVVLKSQFLPQLQIKHLRRQRRHKQNRVWFGSRSGFSSENPVNSDEVSIADYTFAEVTDVSGLGFSYSLGEILKRSVAWLDVLFPVPYWERGSSSSERTGRCWPGARLRLLP